MGIGDKREEDKKGKDEIIGSQQLYFSATDDTLIPCEFCHQMFAASEIILHETGCRPELVSFAKPSSSQDMQLNKSGSGQDSNRSKNIHTTIHTTRGMKSTSFAETKSILPSGKFEHINHRELSIEPGEFLKQADVDEVLLLKQKEKIVRDKSEMNRYRQYPNPPTRCSHSGYIPDEIGNSQHIYSHLPTHYSHSGYVPPETGGSQHLYFSETDYTLIPCEFCHQMFTASEIVLHETGCRPELVSFAKPSSSEDMQLNKSGSGQDSNRSKNIHTTGMKSTSFAETKSIFPSTKLERINHGESNIEPGEFLKSTYDKSSSELYKTKKNAAKEKKKEPLSLLSVWNAGSSNDPKAEDDDDDDSKQISDHSDCEMTISKKQRRHLKGHEKEISEKFDNESEMTEFINFLKPDENKNTESDEEYQIIADVNDVKAQPKSSENEEVLVSNFPDDAQEKHHKAFVTLSDNLKDLYLSGEDCDVTIEVKDKNFRAHRAILRARTPVLHAMFSHNMVESNSSTISIVDCDPKAFQEFLLFIYSGKAENLSEENVTSVYYIADKYSLCELKEECVRFMRTALTTNLICDVICLATRHCEHQLLEDATHFFTQNMQEIFPTVKWQRFMHDNTTQANELLIASLKPHSVRK